MSSEGNSSQNMARCGVVGKGGGGRGYGGRGGSKEMITFFSHFWWLTRGGKVLGDGFA